MKLCVCPTKPVHSNTRLGSESVTTLRCASPGKFEQN